MLFVRSTSFTAGIFSDFSNQARGVVFVAWIASGPR